MNEILKADLEELETYIKHAIEEFASFDDKEMHAYLNDALAKINRMKGEEK